MTLDCDAIFEGNFLKQSFKKFPSKIARKDNDSWLAKTDGQTKPSSSRRSVAKQNDCRDPATKKSQKTRYQIERLVTKYCFVGGV